MEKIGGLVLVSRVGLLEAGTTSLHHEITLMMGSHLCMPLLDAISQGNTRSCVKWVKTLGMLMLAGICDMHFSLDDFLVKLIKSVSRQHLGLAGM